MPPEGADHRLACFGGQPGHHCQVAPQGGSAGGGLQALFERGVWEGGEVRKMLKLDHNLKNTNNKR